MLTSTQYTLFSIIIWSLIPSKELSLFLHILKYRSVKQCDQLKVSQLISGLDESSQLHNTFFHEKVTEQWVEAWTI